MSPSYKCVVLLAVVLLQVILGTVADDPQPATGNDAAELEDALLQEYMTDLLHENAINENGK
jgi:hypothetical protein